MFNQYPYLNVNDLNFDWIIKHFKEFIDDISSLDEWRNTHEAEFEQLKALVDGINEGDWTPEFTAAITNFFSANLVEIVGELVKQLYFGITSDGHFVAYIPESWSDITFGTTGYDDFPVGVDYGHLTLSY